MNVFMKNNDLQEIINSQRGLTRSGAYYNRMSVQHTPKKQSENNISTMNKAKSNDDGESIVNIIETVIDENDDLNITLESINNGNITETEYAELKQRCKELKERDRIYRVKITELEQREAHSRERNLEAQRRLEYLEALLGRNHRPTQTNNANINTDSNVHRDNTRETNLINEQINRQQRNEIKFQKFWEQDPEGWFSLFEAQLSFQRINDDEAKYWSLVQNIGADITCKIASNPSVQNAANKYQAFKDAVLVRYSLTREDRLVKLLGDNPIGNRRPSEYLDYLIKLSKDILTRNTVLTMWRERLPREIAKHLDKEISESNEKKNVDKADYMYRFSPEQVVTVNAVDIASNNNLRDLVAEVSARVDAIQRETSNIRRSRYDDHQRNRGSSQNRKQRRNSYHRRNNKFNQNGIRQQASRSRSPRKKQNNFEFRSRKPSRSVDGTQSECFYHRKFGKKAWYCDPPCSWNQEFNENKRVDANSRYNNSSSEN